MRHKIIEFCKGLFYEDGTPSLTRTLAVLYFILFAAVSIYLVIKATPWQYYDTFAALAGGGGVASQVGNKFINSKYNSGAGTFKEQK